VAEDEDTKHLMEVLVNTLDSLDNDEQ